MLRGGVRPEQIGIITPYHAQRGYVSSYMARNGALRTDLYDDIEVVRSTLSRDEKDIIILSCVRSNEKQGIVFKGPTPAECRFNACKIWIDHFGESKSIVNGVIVMV